MCAAFSIGWAYLSEECLTVDEFEHERRKASRNFALDKQERHDLLLEWGVTKNELISSVRKTLKAKHQRRRTFVNNTSGCDRWEEAVESATRKLRNSWTAVFSKDSDSFQTVLSKRDVVGGKPEKWTLTKESTEHRNNPSFISTQCTLRIEAASRILLSPNNDDTSYIMHEPSAFNAHKPMRPPPSPCKSIFKAADRWNSFPTIVLDDVSDALTSISTKQSDREVVEKEDDDSIVEISSSRSTEYSDNHSTEFSDNHSREYSDSEE